MSSFAPAAVPTEVLSRPRAAARGRLARLLFAVIASSVASCRTGQDALRPDTDGAVRLTIVGTNDVHGWVMPQEERFPQGAVRFGGAAAFAGYLKLLRADNPGGVVLVDGGDLFQGTLMSNLTEGSIVIETFNALGYDAAAIGNHEFDYGPVGAPTHASQPGMDPFGALKARIAQAKFPLLSTNIYESNSRLRPSWLPGDGTVIIERKGIKVGILGLTTPQTPTTTLPINVASLRFAPLGPEALTAAKGLRARGADVVIAVVHAGGRCGETKDPVDLHTCDTETGEVFDMMKGFPYGTLDAVVAGHTHAQIGHFVNGTPVIESFALGRAFGVIDLAIDPQTRKLIRERTRIRSGVPVCETVDEATQSCDVRALKARGDTVKPVPATWLGQRVEPDQAIAELLWPGEARVAALQGRALGLAVPRALGRNYEHESALGSFLADSLRTMLRADVALLNPGGLRADLDQGPLKYGSVYEVLPFDNQVATLDVTGDQLVSLVRAAYAAKKGVFQVSGLEVRLDRCPGPNRLRSVHLPGGHGVDPNVRYRVVMPDFLARGGDGLGPVLATIDPRQVDLGETRSTNLRDELVDFWVKNREPFAAPEAGRVQFVDDGKPCEASESHSNP
ncbi:MAG: 5'-nucleotidase C-terminal domain-containing protein [Myxococcaceae bacterium]|nr:5'-nucleotidase C-terminal domain-containing protein [Myxococcaceae bacterium]